MTYVPGPAHGGAWKDLPDASTPVPAAWYTQADATFQGLEQLVPGAAVKARYVAPTGNNSSDGLTWGTAFATIAAAEAAVPSGGVIYLAPGTHSLPTIALSNAKALVGAGRRVCTLAVPSGATGHALSNTNDGAVMCGFQVDASAATGTLTSGINLGPGQIVDDVIISSAATAITSTACGSARVGTRETVEIYNHTGYAIDIDGDGGLEVTFGKITITRTSSGNASGGIRVTRSSTSDVGGIYLDAVVITAGAGTYGIGLNVTASTIDTRTPVRIGPLCVFDAATTNAFSATNVNLIAVSAGVWMDVAPSSSAVYCVSLTGCGAPLFVGAYIVGSATGGAFDINGGVNPGIWNCIADQGTLIKVHSGAAPTGIQFGGNRGYTTLTNDAATLVGAVNVTDNSGLRVLTSESAGSGVFELTNAEGGAPKFFRVTSSGELQIVKGDFSGNLLTLSDGGIMGVTGDLYANAAFTHEGSFLGFYGHSAAGKPTISGSRGSNAALASLISGLASLGLVTDTTS